MGYRPRDEMIEPAGGDNSGASDRSRTMLEAPRTTFRDYNNFLSRAPGTRGRSRSSIVIIRVDCRGSTRCHNKKFNFDVEIFAKTNNDDN